MSGVKSYYGKVGRGEGFRLLFGFSVIRQYLSLIERSMAWKKSEFLMKSGKSGLL